MRKIKKGEKLDALHQNMVTRLRARDDGGRHEMFMSVVPAHASGIEANENRASFLTSMSEEKVTLVDQNVQTGVFAERLDASLSEAKHHNHEPDQ